MLSSTLELKPLLGAILTHLRSVVEFDAAMIAEFIGPNQYIVLASLPQDLDDAPVTVLRPIDAERDGHLQLLISQREPILIGDIFADHPFAKAQHARWIRLYGECRPMCGRRCYCHCWFATRSSVSSRSIAQRWGSLHPF